MRKMLSAAAFAYVAAMTATLLNLIRGADDSRQEMIGVVNYSYKGGLYGITNRNGSAVQ